MGVFTGEGKWGSLVQVPFILGRQFVLSLAFFVSCSVSCYAVLRASKKNSQSAVWKRHDREEARDQRSLRLDDNGQRPLSLDILLSSFAWDNYID